MKFISMSSRSSPGFSSFVRTIWDDYGVSPETGFECNDAYSIIKLVAAGLGWSIVPDFAFLATAEAGVSYRTLPQKLSLGICYLEPRSEGVSQFIDLAKNFFREELSADAIREAKGFDTSWV